MLYVMRVIVEVNIVDDVISVHLGMLRGLLATVSRLTRINELTNQGDFWASGKLSWGGLGWLFCKNLTFKEWGDVFIVHRDVRWIVR